MWPFKRDSRPLDELPRLGDDAHRWSLAEAAIDSTPLIIRYNESASEWVAHAGLPIKLGLAVPLNSPREGGLPDPEENQQLNEIEDIVTREIDARSPALFALVLTTGVMREFVFYVPAGVDLRAIHEAIQAKVTTHEVQCVAEKETRWNSYRQFTPGL